MGHRFEFDGGLPDLQGFCGRRSWGVSVLPDDAHLAARIDALPWPLIETMREIRSAARTIADTVAAARYALQDGPAPDWCADYWCHTDPQSDRMEALQFVCAVINAGFAAYAPRLTAATAQAAHADDEALLREGTMCNSD